MNKQVFLSLALVALVSFSGANVFAAGVGAKIEVPVDKKDSSCVRVALDKLREFCTTHKIAILGTVATVAGAYMIYKIMYMNNILGFRDFVDGTTETTEKMPVLPQWNSIN